MEGPGAGPGRAGSLLAGTGVEVGVWVSARCSGHRGGLGVGWGGGARRDRSLPPEDGEPGPSQSPAVAGFSSGVPSGDWWATCEWTWPRGAAALGVTHVPCGAVSCHALRLDRRDRTLQPLGGSAVTDRRQRGRIKLKINRNFKSKLCRNVARAQATSVLQAEPLGAPEVHVPMGRFSEPGHGRM